MTVFNRTFYDLNHERSYCVEGDGLPPEMISDLKLSVPNRAESLWLHGPYLSDETIRFLWTASSGSQEKPVAFFSSDQRSMLRIGEPYQLTPLAEGYGGLIVFGMGIRKVPCFPKRFQVSEECCTRYVPSAIPFVGLACDKTTLTGEVLLGSGDPTRLTSSGVALERSQNDFLIAERGLVLSLLDTGEAGAGNPMIAMANGTNSYFGIEGRRGPIFKLFGALPDETGTVRIRFDDHFHFAGITDDLAAEEPFVSGLAIGSDMTREELCRAFAVETIPKESDDPPCEPSAIRFKVLDYE